MTIGNRKAGFLAVAVLGLTISLIAKDFAIPLFTISMFGLMDRLVGSRFIA